MTPETKEKLKRTVKPGQVWHTVKGIDVRIVRYSDSPVPCVLCEMVGDEDCGQRKIKIEALTEKVKK